MKTIAIIPAFNEYTHLADVIRRTQHHVDHVVVIDDGSGKPLADGLLDIPHLTIVRHRVNLGKGAALRTGFEYAVQRQYDFAVLLDADGQHNPDEIPSLLAPLIAQTTDVTLGTRALSEDMPLVARFGNMFLSGSLRVLFGVRARDSQSGYRAMRVDCWDALAWDSQHYSVETEMIVNIGKHHLRYQEIPIQTIYHDKYKGTTVVDGIRIFLSMLAWRIL